MVIDFATARALFTAVEAHLENAEYPGLQTKTAPQVIATARAAAHFFTDENVKAIIQPLDFMNAMILDAEIDGDLSLAENLRNDKERVEVHVARRIIEALTGASTALERQLKASVKSLEERGAKFAETTKRAFPSDVVTSQKVVPLSGRGA